MRPWEQPYAERFANRKPRIALGFVAFGDIDAGVFESCMFWAMQQGVRYHNRFDLYCNVATKREQYRARNVLVQEARKVDADFIVMIDDDHTLADCPDMLGDFFAEEKPLQGGLYVQRRNDKVQPVIQHYDRGTGHCYWATMDTIPVNGGPVDILGGGLNWIDMTVFDFMSEDFWWPFPQDERKVTFKPHPRYGLDMHFCIKAKEEFGIQPWLNGRVKVGHVQFERQVMRPPGMKGNMVCDACDGIASWSPIEGVWTCQSCERRAAA